MNSKRTTRMFMCDFETTVYDNQDYTEVWAVAIVELFTENVTILHRIEDMFTYFRLLSASNIDDEAKANVLLSALNIVRKFRNKATHNLDFVKYRSPLFHSANHIFENTLLYTNEINKTYDDIWGLILSMIILLNNKYLEYGFLNELFTYLNSYGSDMSGLYCRMTGIPIDYQRRFELYISTLTASSTDYNQAETPFNAAVLQNTYSDVAATSETVP